MMNFTLLKKGSTGGAVVELQKKLNELGYNCGNPDGNFGTQTDNAVRKFQADYNLKVDGIAGSATLKKLEEIFNSGTKPVPSDDTPSIDTNKLLQLKAKLNEAIKIIDELI